MDIIGILLLFFMIVLLKVYDFLFALPNSRLRHVPKCKSPRSRTAAFDLLVELVKGVPENYAILHEKLLKQHQPGMNVHHKCSRTIFIRYSVVILPHSLR